MTFKEFYLERVGWKYYGQNTARVDTPLGIMSPNPRGVFGALPAQVSGSEPADMPLWSGGFGSTDWARPNFDLKLPETEVTGQIVNVLNSSTNPGGYDVRKPLVIMVQHTKDAHGKTQTTFEIPHKMVAKMTNKPERNKTCTVVLQRRPDDAGKAPTQIQKIQVF